MLLRFDPFRELDRVAQAAWGQGSGRPNSSFGAYGGMAMDAYRRQGELIVNFDLPGVDPASIDLTVEKNVLTVKAERSFQRNDGDEYIVAERPQGQFTRQLFLGESLDADGIEARYEHGVLTLRIPVAERAKPRKVAVSAGEASNGTVEVEATSSAS